ncbi:pyruvate, phosphate dikinase [Sedimentimonas flavescens]|uniref:Pyruvate, phosphate dikinase n=1 Tax=Sedimentimonas flavescens TaxID=2851012 RepID=A0ABT3A114_9RHOB|nr:putative PEP-binding protein [Sedimentimonas flavescens]MBW0156523.1 pyruvate, phosphate dikinase [Sedimentimonas flavescens]MCT2539014.1 pyruvate, phosphate dikinase [Sedimentimonas flavescens]MCV2879542.1 pyruvate, phosphate dikinase [Sedimentimonas flavescens]WBL32291.1 PEP-utilizing enzyme [Sinirhodobacter sp. HNIBRBA609]
MQKHEELEDFVELSPGADVMVARHGWRAKCLQRLIRLDLPVPRTIALPCETVRAIASGQMPDTRAIAASFGPNFLVSVRSSPENPEWGGPGTVLNVGMNDLVQKDLIESHGREAADALYLRFVQNYATHVARLDPDMFHDDPGPDALSRALAAYEAEMDEPFPQDPARQMGEVLRSMARAWEGTTARLLRQAKGAPVDAVLGLVVQEMALGIGPGLSGSGTMQFVDSVTGGPRITGRFRGQSQGRKAAVETLYLTRDPRGASLEEASPEVFEDLKRYGNACRERLREEMQLEFAVEGGAVSIIDAVRVQRSSRAAVKIAVALAEDGVISREDALLRVEPRALSELLHYQVDPRAPRDRIARGIGASPGAATGKIVFTAAAAQASAARDEPCILVRRETVPEDIRGMHASVAVLTERGGMTSHAAVIARGLGLPCIVGCADIQINPRERVFRGPAGRIFREGEVITIDGTNGEVLVGAAEMLEPALDDGFRTLLHWADNVRDIGVRANADTPDDARTARMFEAEGIGLARTEHMFFDEDRLTVMREMIFADTANDRRVALERLLPMQRADFTALFDIMAGLPVCIRLFDPPLHEFLPHDREGMRELAEALDRPLSEVTRRVEALSEFNPMLGMRGVRLGVTVPEIYDMQARAIFEATVEASRRGAPVVPEVMIPLVSAAREVEIVKARIDAVASAVKMEMKAEFTYRLGVMVETPRAALRAGEIAEHAHFLSFGTNDLTQMTYGLSRDDAGRFMSTYVNQGVYAEDPFHILDVEGVGELLLIGAGRGRSSSPEITISVCGEHGGNPESIAFCRAAGFDYVSCSPFRVPVARLAAAHFALLAPKSRDGF